MKIAQIDVNYGSSSTGKIVHDLHVGLERNGHTVNAFFGRGPSQKRNRVYKISSNVEVAFHALGSRVTGFTGGYSPIATRKLIKALKIYQPDIVHLHDLHGYFLDIGETVDFLKSKKIPTVWTFHADFMFTGKCGSALACDKWQSHCYDCPSLSDYPKSWFFDQSSRMFDAKYDMFENFGNLEIVTPSDWLAKRVRKSVIAGSKNISVIPNGLDLDLFYPRESNRLFNEIDWSAQFTVISVGSDFWSDLKGGKWVIELAKLMPHVLFVMVGVNTTPIGTPRNVKMISPVVDKNLLAEYYSAADVLLLTSSQETFSMVTAESLACGTPVVGFKAGAPEEVAPKGYGTFVDYGDIGGLESCIEGHINRSIYSKNPLECSAFVRDTYSKEGMIKEYELKYEELINGVRP